MPIQQMTDLVNLARDSSQQGRIRLVNSIVEILDIGLKPNEREIAGDILVQVMRQIEQETRALLASHLATHNGIPRELVLFLGQDDISVARPILLESGLLTDQDLIEVINKRGATHARPIAKRDQISELLSQALVDVEDQETIINLITNDGADISEETMAELVSLSIQDKDLQEPLLNRNDLSAELASKLFLWVSSELRRHILANYDLDQDTLDKTIEETITEFLDRNMTTGVVTPQMLEWADRLASCGRLTARLMVKVLRLSQYPMFIAMFSRLANVSTDMARFMVREEGARRLALTCRAVGISKAEFASLFLLSRNSRPGEHLVDPLELRDVLETFENTDPSSAAQHLERWRESA